MGKSENKVKKTPRKGTSQPFREWAGSEEKSVTVRMLTQDLNPTKYFHFIAPIPKRTIYLNGNFHSPFQI